ncbi:hypothetical protein SPHINGOT1_270113 [Sphingomonas sp. T1]|nr:hypothetical protein SPHINGOT1_270113 [Sphingomonas sp. T1]
MVELLAALQKQSLKLQTHLERLTLANVPRRKYMSELTHYWQPIARKRVSSWLLSGAELEPRRFIPLISAAWAV